MKKNILIIGLLIMLLIPINVKAKFDSLNLEQSFKAEGITPNLGDYQENDKQVTIYLFRGQGCTHCEDFLNYLNSIVNTYGNYFKLRSFEVWHNKTNDKLKNVVGSYLGYDVNNENEFGVPFIVIGNKSFIGYREESNEEILNAITEEYNSEEKHDILKLLIDYEEEEMNDMTIVMWVGIIVVVCTVVDIILKSIQNKKLNERLDSIERVIKIKNSK